MVEAASGILTREDKATAMRVLSLSGQALGVAVGAGRFYTDAQGSRLDVTVRAADGGDDERGPLAETRRCISPHVFAVVMARSGRLLSALRAHGAVGADSQGS